MAADERPPGNDAGSGISGEKVSRSGSFRAAKEKANEYARDPGKLDELLDRAVRKADSARQRLVGVGDSLQACFRLLRAWARGAYREIPWSSLVSIVAAVVYFVMPLDLIPDFLLAFGLIDDAALIGWVLSSVKADIDNFVEWEKSQLENESETDIDSEPDR